MFNISEGEILCLIISILALVMVLIGALSDKFYKNEQ